MSRAGKALGCERSHSFDLARSGYVNLLTGHRRLSPSVGDTRPMLLARRRFLESGHYEQLSHSVNSLVASGLESNWASMPDESMSVIDIGSGDGYYLGRLKRSLEALGAPCLCYFGVDVSREAARLASVRYRDIQFVVADTKRELPLVSGRALGVLSIFSPRNPAEFRRLVHPDGLAVMAFPGSDHLAELIDRLGLIQVHPGKEERIAESFDAAFNLVHRQELRFHLDLRAEDLLDLIRMGPSARHLSEEDVLSRIDERDTSATASFIVLVLRPKARI